MTLLELLVKELPGRGGWNINAHGAVQDNSGQVWFYKNGKPDFAGVTWAADNNSNLFDWVQWDLMFKRSEDYKKSIVTREQYEAAIAAQQPAWNGEGLPPVGCECEFNAHERGWEKCTILYVSEYTILLRTDRTGDPEEVFDPCVVKLLPIRTEAERRRDASISAMREFFGHASGLYDLSGFYDEIADGKIPGVEISK